MVVTMRINVTLATTTSLLLNTTLKPSRLGDEIVNYFAIVFSVIILIVGIVGNFLVLLVFGMRYKKLKACEMFMVSLAVSDLIGTIIMPLNSLLQLVEHNFNPIGNFGCRIISFLSMTSVTLSAITLVIISIDRFIIVKWPLRERVQVSFVMYIIIASWVLGSIIGCVYFFGDRIRLHERKSYEVCQDFGTMATIKSHLFATMTVQIFIPIVTITILYALIIYELRKVSKNELFKNHERELHQRLKRNRKATTLLVAIVAVFYICVIPANVFFLIYIYDAVKLSGYNTYRVFSMLSMLQMINSCANPVIYSKLHTSFRRTTLRLFCSCCITKFQGYRWGSLGESFRYAMTTTMSMRSKRSSRGSIMSTRDIYYAARKSLTVDDINHNRKMTECKRLSMMSHGTGSTNSRLCLNEERRSMSVDDPRLRKQLSDAGDDEVFILSPLARKDSLKQFSCNNRSNSPINGKDNKQITINNFIGSPKSAKKRKKYRQSNGSQDSRYLSPTTNCKYEYPIKSQSLEFRKRNTISDEDTISKSPSIGEREELLSNHQIAEVVV